MASLSWSPPASNGGASIEGYEVYVSTSPGQENLAAPDNGVLLVPGTSFNVSELPDGSSLSDGIPYYFVVTAVNAGGQESPASTEASTTPTAEIPAAPTGVTAVAGPYDQSATVSWNPSVEPNGSPASSYLVTASDNTAHTTSTTGCGDPSASSPCIFGGLVDGDSYTFTVTAYNSAHQASAPSAPSNAVVPGPQVAVVPTDVRSIYGNGTADLWFTSAQITPDSSPSCLSGYDSNGACLLGYNVYEGTTPGGEGSTPINGVYPLKGTQYSGDRTEVNVPGLTNGTTYYFTIAVVNAKGVSSQSNETSTTPTNTNPGAPTGVTATAGASSITLNWTAPASTGGWPVREYEVWRCTGTAANCAIPARQTGSSFSWYGNSTSTSFTDNSVLYGSTYYYEVVTETFNTPNHLVDLGESNYSADSSTVSSSPSGTAPSAPTLNGWETGSGTNAYYLTWTPPSYDGSSNTISYAVFIDGSQANGTNGGTCYTGSLLPASTTNCTTAALTSGVSHTFYVVAINGNSQTSAPSNSVETQGNPPYNSEIYPSAPQGFSASGGEGFVSLSWSAPGYEGVGSGSTAPTVDYNVYINGVLDGYCNAGASTSVSCYYDNNDNPLSNGTSYTWAVSAVSGGNEGPQTGAVSATPVDNDDRPNDDTPNISVTAPSATASTVTLAWTAAVVDGASPPLLGYNVYRSGNGRNGDYHLINTSIVSGTSFVATGLPASHTFWFEVCAVNAIGRNCGLTSAFTTPETLPNNPGNVQVVTNGSLFQTSWNTPTNTGGGTIVGYVLVASVQLSCIPTTEPVFDVLNAPAAIGIGYAGFLIALDTWSANGAQNLVTTTSAVGDLLKAQQTLSAYTLVNGFGPDCSIMGYHVDVVGIDVYPSGDVFVSIGTGTPVNGQVGALTPDAPSTVSASPAGGGGAFVAWSTPSDNGAPITGYTVTPVVNGVAGTAKSLPASANSYTFHGLRPGTNVYFTVAAVNSVGTGAAGQSNSVTIPKYVSHVMLRTNRHYVKYGHEGAVVLSVTVKGFGGTATGIVRIPGACVIHLKGGKGSCRLGKDTLLPGTHHLRAHYQGSSRYNASGSGTVTVIVTKK